ASRGAPDCRPDGGRAGRQALASRRCRGADAAKAAFRNRLLTFRQPFSLQPSSFILVPMGFFDKIKQSLTRTKEQFVGRFEEIVRRADEPAQRSRPMDLETVEALE